MRPSKKTLALAGDCSGRPWSLLLSQSRATDDHTGVPSANTKSAGYAPASMLSPELAQIAVAQGSTKVENPSRGDRRTTATTTTSLEPGGQPLMVPTAAGHDRGAQDRAGQEHVPRLRARACRRRPGLRLRHALPLPGPRGRHARLHHAHQPRRRRRAPRDAARHAGQERQRRSPTIDGSTWDPWAQRLLFTTENANAADVRGDAGLPVDGRGRLGRARPRRLRGHPGRLRREHLDRRGHRRREQAGHDARRCRTASSTATSRDSRATCTTASSRCCRC